MRPSALCRMIITFLWVQPVFGTRLADFYSGKNLLGWAFKMSVSIDRMIKKAEKSAKFGDFEAAIMTCIDALETYPENPRLQALAKRLSRPQITNQHNKDPKNAALPEIIIDEEGGSVSRLKDIIFFSFRRSDPIFNSSKVFIFILSSQVSNLVLLNVIVDSSPREFHHLKTRLIYVMLN